MLPTMPTDGSMPASPSLFVYLIDRYWADSTGRRDTIVDIMFKDIREGFSGGSLAERLARPCVEGATAINSSAL